MIFTFAKYGFIAFLSKYAFEPSSYDSVARKLRTVCDFFIDDYPEQTRERRSSEALQKQIFAETNDEPFVTFLNDIFHSYVDYSDKRLGLVHQGEKEAVIQLHGDAADVFFNQLSMFEGI